MKDREMLTVLTDTDRDYMEIALKEARVAADKGDVPVGAVIVRNGEVIFAAHNTREAKHMATGHAEVNAITEACRRTDGKWLSDCTLYVTLEPCPMCAWAILEARIPRVVCGATDPVAGAMGSVWALHRHASAHTTDIVFGVAEEESRELLQVFFRRERLK